MSLWITYIHVLKPMKACFALKDIVWESHVATHAEFLRSSFHCHDFHYFASTFIQIFNKFVSLVANGHRYNSKSNGDYMHDRIQSSQRWPRNRLNVQRGLWKVYDLDSIQIAEKQRQTWCFLLLPKGSWAIVGGWHMLHNTVVTSATFPLLSMTLITINMSAIKTKNKINLVVTYHE